MGLKRINQNYLIKEINKILKHFDHRFDLLIKSQDDLIKKLDCREKKYKKIEEKRKNKFYEWLGKYYYEKEYKKYKERKTTTDAEKIPR